MSPRPPKYRFYLDENFPAPSGKFLQSLSHNVFYVVQNEKLRSRSDLFQIKEAAKRKRIFLALDKDFKVNPSLSGAISRGPGVVLVSSSDPTSKRIKDILKMLLKDFSETKVRGKICYVSINKTSYLKIT